MLINIEVLKAHNTYDKSIELIRDIELTVLKENRYKLTDLEYKVNMKQYITNSNVKCIERGILKI